MKTNPAARYLVRIRLILVCVILATVVGLEFYLGESLAARIGQTTAPQDPEPQAPNVDIFLFQSLR